MEDGSDPPLSYRSMGIDGSEYCETIKIRNKMSMMKLWESSCDGNDRDFYGEISARNPCLKNTLILGFLKSALF